MPLPPPSLKGRALRLLSTREHSRTELERKLRRHEVEPGQLCKVLDELQAKGFIDAQRVVESVVHQRAAKLGVARIRQELQHKGVAGDEAAAALAALQATELARARQVWRKKFGSRPADAEAPEAPDAAQRARQMRFLAARGFSGDTIRRVVSGADELLDETSDAPGA
ncbi:MAG: recombination regulator RecX [Burkholderiaceae bacterium]|nr:recombination regulator RecX [Rhodoferax sp.]MCW5627744.1 recombination regulator RecX [Rhodoferax sp.]MCW5644117.1 recombination regulator RecX [Rhodoferax sp.]